jgi:hypothetical protein
MSKQQLNFKITLKFAKKTLKIGRTSLEIQKQRQSNLKIIFIQQARRRKKSATSQEGRPNNANSSKIR